MTTPGRYSDADTSDIWFFMNSVQVLHCFLTLKFVGFLTRLLSLLVKLLFYSVDFHVASFYVIVSGGS